MSPWPWIENIAVIVCATTLAYAWDMVWPLLLLMFLNTQVRSQK